MAMSHEVSLTRKGKCLLSDAKYRLTTMPANRKRTRWGEEQREPEMVMEETEYDERHHICA